MSEKEYIDITPSWRAAVRIYMAVLEDGNEAGKVAAREDLTELGERMDAFNAVDWGIILTAATQAGSAQSAVAAARKFFEKKS